MRASLVAGLLVLLYARLSVQQSCVITQNTNYNTAGDLLTLYNIPSAQACCTACSEFVECTYFAYTKSSSSANYKQCVIKSGAAALVAGTNTAVDSGTNHRIFSRPTACGTQLANTDYPLTPNITSSTSSSASDCCFQCSVYAGCSYWTHIGSTCYLKANTGNTITHSGATSGTVIPTSISSTKKRTGNRGLGLFGTESCSDILLLGNVSWVYNWAASPGVLEECLDELGIQFIPMIWDSNTDYTQVYSNSPYLLTFNEPNFPAQSNMTPQAAAAEWPKIEAVAAKYGMNISSPSASYGGGSDPIAWLDQFFALCVGCKVDFITTHQYDCNFYSLYGAITTFQKYNKTVWVTEFGCLTGSTVASVVTFVDGILPLFEENSFIGKYAYFGSRSGGGTSTYDLFNSSWNALTAAGVAYAGGPLPGSFLATTASYGSTGGPSSESQASSAGASSAGASTSSAPTTHATAVLPLLLFVLPFLYLN